MEIEKTLKKPRAINKRQREEPEDVSDDDDDDVMVNSLQPEDRVDRSKKPRLDLGPDDVDEKGNLVDGDQIMAIFRELSESGMTILMITHEPAIAECADKTYRILDGELFTGETGGVRHGR